MRNPGDSRPTSAIPKFFLLSISFCFIFVILFTTAFGLTSDTIKTFDNNDNEDIKLLFFKNFFKFRRRIKREEAFDLLKLENDFEAANDRQLQNRDIGQSMDGEGLRRDDALSDEKCQKRCNERLRSGLDMVKAHSSFGSIGVPSVIDRFDLEMFCKLDTAHDRCLKECGFEIHFNMRDYVCKDRFTEMVSNLACYEHSAMQLKRKCGGQRCGPYSELEVSLLGFAHRCRTLLCDLNCTQNVLITQCGKVTGLRASKFLMDYSRVQISSWMSDVAKVMNKTIAQIIPPSCTRLFCERFDLRNCTSIITSPTSFANSMPAAPIVTTTTAINLFKNQQNPLGISTPLINNKTQTQKSFLKFSQMSSQAPRPKFQNQNSNGLSSSFRHAEEFVQLHHGLI